jgi:esterase
VSFVPSHDVLGEGERLAFVCHGILGSRQNWRGFARRLAAALPGWRVVTPDHRNHGDATGAPGPHTVDACADDLATLADHLGQAPEVVVGHSFGGKVALAYVERHGDGLEQAWVLDASPEIWSPAEAADNEVSRVVDALRTVPQPLPRRDEVVDHLTGMGFQRGLARWMTTNLRRTPEGFVWRFDLPAVREMMSDYYDRDLWLALEVPRIGPEVHVVHAARSARWKADVLARLRSPPGGAPTHLHTLADAGHWLHVDAPDALLALMVEHWTP